MMSVKSDAIAMAFLKAQKEFPPIKKSGHNKHFGSDYPTLDDVLEAIKPVLNKNGMFLRQNIQIVESKDMMVTLIFHPESGQWIESMVPIYVSNPNMQTFKSACTYARRMGISLLCGVESELDDDAETAVGRTTSNSKQPSKLGNSAHAVDNQTTRTTFGLPPFSNLSIEQIWESHPKTAVDLANGYKDQYDKKEKIPPQAIELMKYGKSKGLWPKST